MYLAYFDESGDSGPVSRSPTKFFVLACILIPETAWLENLNTLIEFRKTLRRRYGIPLNSELKANHVRRGRGALKALGWSRARRAKMFEYLLYLQNRKMTLSTFAVAIDKSKLQAGRDARAVAWQYTLQRVDTFCRKNESLACLFPDAGHGYFIRRMVRRLRRHQQIEGRFGGLLNIEAERIVEDPNERDSQDSYFVQMADWNAYAAHRSNYVHPIDPGYVSAWDKLGDTQLREVNKLRGGPPAIVIYP